MDDLVEIQQQYDYYCQSRIIPIFISKEDLLCLTYDEFLSPISRSSTYHENKRSGVVSFEYCGARSP